MFIGVKVYHVFKWFSEGFLRGRGAANWLFRVIEYSLKTRNQKGGVVFQLAEVTNYCMFRNPNITH